LGENAMHGFFELEDFPPLLSNAYGKNGVSLARCPI